MFTFKAVVNLQKLAAFNSAVKADLEGSGNGALRRALRRCGLIYLGALQARYMRNSGGGGEWPPLSRETLRRRARRRRGGTGILLVTKTLYNALNPDWGGNPGQVVKDIPNGVAVGYGGSARHPDSNLTISDLARVHHFGTRHIPARTILVPPDDPAKQRMREVLSVALKSMGAIRG